VASSTATIPRELRTPGAYHTASTLLLRNLLAYARSHGVDADRLLRELAVTPAMLDDPDARVPEATQQRAWTYLAAATRDEALGVHVAESSEDGAFEVLDYAVHFSGTLREAIDRIGRFYRLLSDSLAIEIAVTGDSTRVRRSVTATEAHEQDAFFAIVCNRLRQASGRDVRPRAVCFEHAPHAARALADFFRCPVRFRCAQSEIVFASADLELPVDTAKPKLAALLDRYAAELLAKLPTTSSYADHVRRAIAHVMAHGAPTLETIARQMRASPRTVQRRLAEAGTTHRDMVDDVRKQLAQRYLQSSRLSITEIAYLLGFQEESSFRRAFKKWTGESPTRARGRKST